MKYPEELVAQVKQRAAGYRLEGFLSGQGKINPPLMIVGELPEERKLRPIFRFLDSLGRN